MILARESSADLVQSVCREVIQDLDRFSFASEAAFRHWLYTTAERKILDRARYWRRAKRDAGREVDLGKCEVGFEERLLESYGSLCTPSRDAIAREQLARVERAFERLPEDYRQVVLLSRIVGLSQAEIAQEMGRSIDSVRNLLFRAMARMTSLLGADST
jgi:RNA polymerase sigma-70 factor (ECF subfamily)